jgi:hypothetical protein
LAAFHCSNGNVLSAAGAGLVGDWPDCGINGGTIGGGGSGAGGGAGGFGRVPLNHIELPKPSGGTGDTRIEVTGGAGERRG